MKPILEATWVRVSQRRARFLPRRFSVAVVAFGIICFCTLLGSCCEGQRKIAVSWAPGYAYVPCCKEMVRYQATSFEIQGVKVPVPALGGGVEVAGVKLDPKVLNQAYQTTQTLDAYFRSTCPYLASYSGNKEKFEQMVADMVAAETKLTQLALSLQSAQPTATPTTATTTATPAPTPAAASAGAAPSQSPPAKVAAQPAASPAPAQAAARKGAVRKKLAKWVAAYSKKTETAIVKTPAKANPVLGLPASAPTPPPLPK